MKFTVKRSTWWRGKGSGTSYLLREDGNMCCLGFRALASGLKPRDIFNRAMPATALRALLGGVPPEWMNLVKFLTNDVVAIDTDACQDIALVNDERGMSDFDRERELTRMFAAVGDEVDFVD